MKLPLRCCDAASSNSSPDIRVNWQPPTIAIPQINEPAVIAGVSVSEKPCQQRKSVLGEDLIYKGLLALQAFRCTAAWESVIIQTGIH